MAVILLGRAALAVTLMLGTVIVSGTVVQADELRSVEGEATRADSYNRGVERLQGRDYRAAAADFTQALQLNPDDADAYFYRGMARETLGDDPGALEDYSQSLQLRPNNALAYDKRAVIRARLGDRQGAFQDFDQAQQLAPDLALVYQHRGNLRAAVGDQGGAVADLQQAADLYRAQGHPDLVRQLTHTIQQLQP